MWDLLEQWYQDNGTLSYEESSNGKRKAIWNDQPRKSDSNVKAVNQVIARFSVLFPKAKVVPVPRVGGGKPRMGLQGIGLIPSLTQLSESVTQSLPNSTPEESLQDKDFNPSNPIPDLEKENQNLGHIDQEVAQFPSPIAGDKEVSDADLSVSYTPSSDDNEAVQRSAEFIRTAIAEQNWAKVQSLTKTWTKQFKKAVWAQLTSVEHKALKAIASSQSSTNTALEKKLKIGDLVEWTGDSYNAAHGCDGELVEQVFSDFWVKWAKPDGTHFKRRDCMEDLKLRHEL